MFDHDDNNKFIMRKGIKGDFFNTIQSEASGWETSTELLPTVSPMIYVIDALAFIQRYQTLKCGYIWRITGAIYKENNDKETRKM